MTNVINYKLSHYTIFSENVNIKKDRVLYCSRTGEAIVITDNIYQNIKDENWDAIPANVIQTLLNHKGIVALDEDELVNIVNENKIDVDEDEYLYEVIQPSAMCQLDCYYCGQKHTKDYLTKEFYIPLLERIRKKASLKSYKGLYIGWFGGEPIMALSHIRELTHHLKTFADEYGMTYGAKIVTNGLSLKENIFVELVNDLLVDSIEITLDGTAEFHDSHRYTKEKGKSFELIFKNILDICNRSDYSSFNCQLSIRCNVDKKNWEGVSPLIKLISENNLQKKIAYFYPIGIYSWGGNDAQQESLTKEEFAEKEIDWFIELFEAGFNPSLLPRRVKKVCLAVSKTSEMYDPFGNIFNCTEVSLTDVYKNTPYTLGNLKENPPEFDKVHRPLTDWNDTLLTDQFPCHTCKMLPVCGGGCPKSWHEDMRACPTPKFNIKERLALAYVVSKTDIKELLEA